MHRISVTAEVDVDIDLEDHIDHVDDDFLITELESRGFKVEGAVTHPLEEYNALFTNLYYALSAGKKDEAIKIINPLLDEIIGRQV